jgi:flagellar protein FlaG
MKIESPLAPPTGSVPAASVPSSEAVVRAATASPAAQASPSQATRQPTQRDLQQAVDELQRKAQSFSPNLRFSVDRDTGRTVVRVTDANTQEVIRQIPAEEVLQLAKELDRMQGLLFHKEA